MLGDVLKALDMLLAAMRGEDEKKRQKVAKEMLHVYVSLGTVIGRGRELLNLLGKEQTPVHRGISISLLTRQHQALRELCEQLTTGSVGTLLQLHVPSLQPTIFGLLSMKGDRVWLTLDQLVADGKPVSPREWVRLLQSRMADIEEPEDYAFTLPHGFAEHDVIPLDGSQFAPRRRSWYGDFGDIREAETFVLATPGDLEKGHQILDGIAASREELRKFLVEKFRLEDVL